jgi:uncharacterized RDD family membrane protein YckC
VSDPTQPVPPQSPVPPVPPYGYGTQPGYFGAGYLPPAQPLAPTGQPLAEFLDRLLAVLIDGAILFAASLVLLVPAVIAMVAVIAANAHIDEDTGEATTDAFPALVVFGIFAVVLLLTFVLNYIYEVEMMYRRGQTIGKRVMKIRIICTDPAAQMTRGVAAKRWLANIVAGSVIPFWRWIDGLWQLWDKPYRQCLHDKFANTVVVKLPA